MALVESGLKKKGKLKNQIFSLYIMPIYPSLIGRESMAITQEVFLVKQK
jgi:hypothetical protein